MSRVLVSAEAVRLRGGGYAADLVWRESIVGFHLLYGVGEQFASASVPVSRTRDVREPRNFPSLEAFEAFCRAHIS